METAELRDRLPTRIELLWPSYRVFGEANRALTVSEHDDLVAQRLSLDPALLEVPASKPYEREFAVRLRTARHHLKRCGLIRSGGHGVWRLSDDHPQPPGTAEELRELKRQADRRGRQAKAAKEAREEKEDQDQSDMRQSTPGQVLPDRPDPPADAVTALLQQQRQSLRDRLLSLKHEKDGVAAHLQKLDAQIELLEDEYRERVDALRQHGIIVDSLDDWL